jgi:outer membrane receptor protein involved in Fe transport
MKTNTPKHWDRLQIHTVKQISNSLIRMRAVLLIAGLLAPVVTNAQVANAVVSKEATASSAGEVVTLNPFQVTEDSDKSYGALNSNSMTQFNTQLQNLPITADIFTDAFMKDVGETTSVEAMIQNYSAGAGIATTTPGKTATTNPMTNAQNAGNSISLRGLSSTVMRRDTFMSIAGSNGATSLFDIDRVEVINGPQSLLYGTGGAGGVVNMVSKQARFNQIPTGSLEYKFDQYGAKLGQLDYSVGGSILGIRLAILDQQVAGYEQYLGGPLKAEYLQLALHPVDNTVIRITGEKMLFTRIDNMSSQTVTALSTSNDARNGDTLHYLLATNQMASAANGAASGMGLIGNGFINWSNVDALDGRWGVESFNHSWVTAVAQSKWSDMVSTEFDAGYDNLLDPRMNASNFSSILAPNVTSNPTGTWALASTGKAPAQNQNYAVRSKSFRASILLTNELGNFAKSQTLIGADFNRQLNAKISYSYFQTDSNYGLIVNPATAATNAGRTIIPSVYIPIGNGPIRYPLWGPFAPFVNYNGANYSLQINNQINPNLISPANPLGVTTVGGQNYSLLTTINKGYYFINDTSWLDNKLHTLVGARLMNNFTTLLTEVAAPQNYYLTKGQLFNYNLGANYDLNRYMHPYINFSDSYNPPSAGNGDPLGNYGGTAHGVGEEAGIKLSNAKSTISGSIALFHVKSTNEPLAITNTLSFDINPSGLNGRAGAAPSTWISVNRESEGINLSATMAPTADWRMRLSAAWTKGKIGSNVAYNQLYNDQFYANSAGQVTYADGTVVYVPATYNSKSLTVASTTSGAVPLTIAMMSSSSSSYYANPLPISGAILSSSPAAAVLKVVDPVHGAILTGKTGLPISSIQINPGFTPASSLTVQQSGDSTVGYPVYAINFTNMYSLRGPLKGVSVGGTLVMTWKNNDYFYYPNGPIPGAPDAVFALPNLVRFDPILSYTKKFKKVTFQTQLNITNVFNHYHVVVLPNPVTGYSGINDAAFDSMPRYYSLTNTISF